MLITEAICNFIPRGYYAYTDRFGKYRMIHVLKRRGRYLEYEDKVGVKHRSKLYIEDEDIVEYIYLGRTGVKVDAFDLVDMS